MNCWPSYATERGFLRPAAWRRVGDRVRRPDDGRAAVTAPTTGATTCCGTSGCSSTTRWTRNAGRSSSSTWTTARPAWRKPASTPKLKSLLHRKCGGDKAPEQLKVRLLAALHEVIRHDGHAADGAVATTGEHHGASGTRRARPTDPTSTVAEPHGRAAGFCDRRAVRAVSGSGVGPLAVVGAGLPAGLLLAGALTHGRTLRSVSSRRAATRHPATRGAAGPA